MSTTQDLQKILDAFDDSSEGRGFDLRLDLAEIILRRLGEKGWTQNRLSEAAGMKPPQITKIIHADSNATFETAGRILFALGVKAKLVEVDQAVPGTSRFKTYEVHPRTVSAFVYAPTMNSYGQ